MPTANWHVQIIIQKLSFTCNIYNNNLLLLLLLFTKNIQKLL